MRAHTTLTNRNSEIYFLVNQQSHNFFACMYSNCLVVRMSCKKETIPSKKKKKHFRYEYVNFDLKDLKDKIIQYF